VISRLVPDHGALLKQAHEIGKRIAARPPLACAYAKEAARKGIEMELQAGLNLEKELFVLLLPTQDRLEAAAAFKEKRAPVFTGK
jgi:enoyl-CoA hydratase/carnithine racemase